MKPLIVLIAVFVITLIVTKLFYGNYEIDLSGRIAMSAMLLFSAVGHFVFSKGMSMMVPSFIPYKTQVVYATGVIEVLAAIGLLVPEISKITAYLLMVFFILILPANIYAAIKNVDYQKGTYNGNGVTYLWFRVPLQIFFIVWTYLFAITGYPL
jgi:uncharacterized membrane protein